MLRGDTDWFVVETGNDSLPNTIVITGAEENVSVTYFRVAERIEGVRTNPDDTVGPSGSRVNGYVFQGGDEYRFASVIRNFGYDGSIRVLINGQEVDPAALAGNLSEVNGSTKPDPSSGVDANGTDRGNATSTPGNDDTPTPIDVPANGSEESDGKWSNGTDDDSASTTGPGSGILPAAVPPAVLLIVVPAAVALLLTCVVALRRRFDE